MARRQPQRQKAGARSAWNDGTRLLHEAGRSKDQARFVEAAARLSSLPWPNASIQAQEAGDALSLLLAEGVPEVREAAANLYRALLAAQQPVSFTTTDIRAVLSSLADGLASEEEREAWRGCLLLLLDLLRKHGPHLGDAVASVEAVALRHASPSGQPDLRLLALECLDALLTGSGAANASDATSAMVEALFCEFDSSWRFLSLWGDDAADTNAAACCTAGLWLAAAKGLSDAATFSKSAGKAGAQVSSALEPFLPRLIHALNHLIQPVSPRDAVVVNPPQGRDASPASAAAFAALAIATPSEQQKSPAELRALVRSQALQLLTNLASSAPKAVQPQWALFLAPPPPRRSSVAVKSPNGTTYVAENGVPSVHLAPEAANNTSGLAVRPAALVAVMERDPAAHVRAAAAAAAAALVKNMPLRLWLGSSNAASVAATPAGARSVASSGGLAARVAPAILHLQERLVSCLGREQSPEVLSKLCVCAGALARSIDFETCDVRATTNPGAAKPTVGNGGPAAAECMSVFDLQLLHMLDALAAIAVGSGSSRRFGDAAAATVQTAAASALAAALATKEPLAAADVFLRSFRQAPPAKRSGAANGRLAGDLEGVTPRWAPPQRRGRASGAPADATEPKDKGTTVAGATFLECLLLGAKGCVGGPSRSEALLLLARLARLYPWTVAVCQEDVEKTLLHCFVDSDQNVRLHAVKVVEEALRGRAEAFAAALDAAPNAAPSVVRKAAGLKVPCACGGALSSGENGRCCANLASNGKVWAVLLLQRLQRAFDDPYHGVRAVACACHGHLLPADWAALSAVDRRSCVRRALSATSDAAPGVAALACRVVGELVSLVPQQEWWQGRDILAEIAGALVKAAAGGGGAGRRPVRAQALWAMGNLGSALQRCCFTASADVRRASGPSDSGSCRDFTASMQLCVLDGHAAEGMALLEGDVVRALCRTALAASLEPGKAAASAIRALGFFLSGLNPEADLEDRQLQDAGLQALLDGVLGSNPSPDAPAASEGAAKASWGSCAALASALRSPAVHRRMPGAPWAAAAVAALSAALYGHCGVAGGAKAQVQAAAALAALPHRDAYGCFWDAALAAAARSIQAQEDNNIGDSAPRRAQSKPAAELRSLLVHLVLVAVLPVTGFTANGFAAATSATAAATLETAAAAAAGAAATTPAAPIAPAAGLPTTGAIAEETAAAAAVGTALLLEGDVLALQEHASTILDVLDRPEAADAVTPSDAARFAGAIGGGGGGAGVEMPKMRAAVVAAVVAAVLSRLEALLAATELLPLPLRTRLAAASARWACACGFGAAEVSSRGLGNTKEHDDEADEEEEL